MATEGFYVYVHRRRDTNEVFYVGKGLGKRAWKKTSRSEWWKRIEAKSGRSVEIVCQRLTEDQAFELERSLIQYYGAETLCNLDSGGMGGKVPSSETRSKMSAASKGRPKSLEMRIRLSASNAGRRHSDEAKAKIKAARAKQIIPPMRPELRLRMSEMRKGTVFTAEHCRKISESKKGRPGHAMSDATKLKLAIASSGKIKTAETIEKIRQKAIGRTHSQETKDKMTIKNRQANALRKIKVQCSNGMLFDCAGDAVVWLRANGKTSASRGNISSCCSGKLKSAYGFTWSHLVVD